jgi:hypothetical protein
MLKLIKSIFNTKSEPKNSDLVPKGIRTTMIPSVFIDGNKNPVWDNNHKLLKNSKKETFIVW